MVGSCNLWWEKLSAVGCGCLQKGVVVCGRECLSANGSGCLWQAVVFCGRGVILQNDFPTRKIKDFPIRKIKNDKTSSRQG